MSGTRETKSAPCNCNKSSIIFLQRKQTEILSELHQEIASLKRENSDLKFQLFTKREDENLKERRRKSSHYPSRKQSNAEENSVKISKLMTKLKKSNAQINCLEQTLTAMDKMLVDSSLLQVQVETQNRVQQLEINALQRELEDLRTSETSTKPSPLNTKTKCHTSRLAYEEEKHVIEQQRNHRRRSFSTSCNPLLPRRSSLSTLPTNYKESVVTLPPINLKIESPGMMGRNVPTFPITTNGNHTYGNLEASLAGPSKLEMQQQQGIDLLLGNIGYKKMFSSPETHQKFNVKGKIL